MYQKDDLGLFGAMNSNMIISIPVLVPFACVFIRISK